MTTPWDNRQEVSTSSATPVSADSLDYETPDVVVVPTDTHNLGDFSALRVQCDQLISSEHVDKDVALGILKLLHAAETMMLQMRYTNENELGKLRHELDLVRMTSRNSEMVSSLSSDIHKTKDTVKMLQLCVEQLQQTSAKRR